MILFKCLFLYYILIVGRHQVVLMIHGRSSTDISGHVRGNDPRTSAIHGHHRSPTSTISVRTTPKNQLAKNISSTSAKLISAQSCTGINLWTPPVMILTFKRNDNLDKLCVNFVKYIIGGDGKSLRKCWGCRKKVFFASIVNIHENI